MTQLLLNIGRGQIPERHFKWLLQANVGAMRYFPKPTRRNFYAFKDRILRERALADGVSLQTIIQMCNRCDGTGWIYEGGCHHCSGRGVYKVSHVRLQRWLLNDTILHCPEGEDTEVKVDGWLLDEDGDHPQTKNKQRFQSLCADWALNHEYREHFAGLFPRQWIPENQAYQAWYKLQWHYEPEDLRSFHRWYGYGRLRDWIYGRVRNQSSVNSNQSSVNLL